MRSELRTFNTILAQIEESYHDAAAALGLSDSAFNILYAICEEGDGCKQSALYKGSGQKKTTVNSAIRRMERQGLLYLTPGEGRNTRVYLTGEGKRRAGETVLPIIDIEDAIFSAWTESDRAQFLALNRRYLDMFREKTEALRSAGQANETEA